MVWNKSKHSHLCGLSHISATVRSLVPQHLSGCLEKGFQEVFITKKNILLQKRDNEIGALKPLANVIWEIHINYLCLFFLSHIVQWLLAACWLATNKLLYICHPSTITFIRSSSPPIYKYIYICPKPYKLLSTCYMILLMWCRVYGYSHLMQYCGISIHILRINVLLIASFVNSYW